MSRIGLHHYHSQGQRKKNKQSLTNERLKQVINKLVYLTAFAAIIGNLPQLLKVWMERNTQGVSMLTWAGFAIGSLFWLLYGIIHQEKPIIVTNTVLLIIQLLVVIGLILNRGAITF